MRDPSIATAQYTKGIIPYEQDRWRQFLDRELSQIQAALQRVADGHLDKTFVEPLRAREADLRYADGIQWDPYNGEGLYAYVADEWRQFLGVDLWEDLRFPFTTTKLGANQKPDFDYINSGLLFPQNSPLEKVYFTGAIPHAYKRGTDIGPHIHWRQESALEPVWKLDYKWYNTGDPWPSTWTTITSTSVLIPYPGSGSISQVSIFPFIDGEGKREASLIQGIVYRDDNIVTGDVLAFEFDYHYQSSKTGTSQEYPT